MTFYQIANDDTAVAGVGGSSARRVTRAQLQRPVAIRRALAALLLALTALRGGLDAKNPYSAALDSITTDELGEHVDALADDIYEGRLAGSRGGYAAGQYLVRQLRHYVSLVPAGDDGAYYQSCPDGGRNILALLPGTDPGLQQEVVVVGAHYDHVGNGSRGHVLGPVGKIYNGADDNASGVAVLLEMMEAFDDTPPGTRRSILFALWDAEELGMIGSRHWLDQPTVERRRIRLAINIDMVGRLREGRLQVLGTRSGYGLRRLFSGPVDEPLWLDFSWEMKPNSDHWSFLERDVPTVLLHTGMHADYHRPTDDADRINRDGLRDVGRYLMRVLTQVANADDLPAFRPAGLRENVAAQRRREQLPPPTSLDEWPRHLPPPRLGLSWRGDDAEPRAVTLIRVVAGTPADAAGLAVHDRIDAVNDQAFADAAEFRTLIHGLLDTGEGEFSLSVETRGRLRTATVHWPSPPLAESP